MTRTGGVKTLRDRFMHEHDPVFLALLLSPFSRHFRDFFWIFFLLFFFLFANVSLLEGSFAGGSQGALRV